MNSKQGLKYTIGLDIGIASVGWAVLGENRIIDLGVRCFDAAEDPKTGDSLNTHRRLIKTQRNRLHRRVLRMKKLRRLLRDIGAVPSADIEHFASTSSKKGSSAKSEPWELRAKGLDSKLEGAEWARTIYHIIKHRGFYAARKSETINEEKEGGKLTQGIKRTSALMQGKWRTLGEMAARDEAFVKAKRNKSGSYLNSFSRSLLDSELRQLFEAQRKFKNTYASFELEKIVLELLWYQKPAVTGKAMLEMVGHCTFEKDEYRAPKRSFSSERFIWLSKLNNIKIIQAGERRSLTAGERNIAKDLPYKLAKVTYKQLRRALGLSDAPEVGFAGFSYGNKRNKKGELIDPDEATLIELKGWHALKKEISTASNQSTWERLSGNALAGNPIEMDAIALALSIYKSDAELRPELAKIGLNETTIDAVLRVDYSNFIQLSGKYINKLMPHMESGLRYDEACVAAGYNHAKPDEEIFGSKYLPSFGIKDIRNPVVFRALNQTRKVVNALIRKYGSPVAVHIELARDLSKTWEERKEIEAGQKEFQTEKQAAVDYFTDQVSRTPKGDELLKMRLYREQDGQCAYSGLPLAPNGDVRCIFEDNITQIDHVLPYSRSFDDSQNNKVLVLTKQNQDKGNQIPFEFLDGINDSFQWHQFEAWVRSHKNLRKAKRDRLLRKSFTSEEAEGFKARNLNDTRYITSYFASYVRKHLQFAPDNDGRIRPPESRVLCPAGGYTSFLRTRWGLLKNRSASDLHHALDACVIAAANRSLQKRVSDFSRKGELVQLSDGTFADRETGEILNMQTKSALGEHFPQPWSHFRDEVLARLSDNPIESIQAHFSTYDDEALQSLRPVLVSRAVKRRAGGALHEATLRSPKLIASGKSSIKIPLQQLKLAKIKDIVGYDDPRNESLIFLLKTRLEQNGDDGKKAFLNPVFKPSKTGIGTLVRTVKITGPQKNGVKLSTAIADLGDMHHVDVFISKARYIIEPVYQISSDKLIKSTKLPTDAKFLFALNKNDYIKIQIGENIYEGYFVMYESDGRLTLRAHDQPKPDKQFFRKSVSTANLICKYNIDILGKIYYALKEQKNDLA